MIRDQRNYSPNTLSPTIKAIVEALVPLKIDVLTTGTPGNGADTTEDVLKTFSIPANTMGANGVAGFEIEAFGTFAANGDNKTVKLYFGAVSISTGVVTDNAKNWRLRLRVYRSGANTQVITGDGIHDVTPVTPLVTTGASVETGAIVTKVSGQAGTANANDIVCKTFVVKAIEQKNVT